MSWPGWEESPAPAVVLPARPRQSRLRHGSEAYIQQHLSPQTVLVDVNGNMLPPVVDQYGRIQRSSSVSGPRPAIIINNDNGAQNAQYTDDRLPRRASSHRRHRSSTSGYYDNEIVRVRSGSRRRMTPSPEIDEYEEDYYYDGGDRRRKVIHYHHGRRPSSSSSHDGRRHYRSAEDEAALKKLDEMEREKKAEEQRKQYEKEMQMKKLKEEQERLQREKENKELKEKAIEEYKIKQSEEEEKKKKRDEEEEEKMVRIFMAANPGTTERDARKFIRRGERNLERFGNGESEEFPSMRDMSSALTRSRPTHIKVHSRYLSPETLDVYNLPWAWDERDSGYIIIKQWVSEHEQEVLFNHTRKIKERARLTYPRELLKADSNQIVILKKDDEKKRKKSPNPIKRTSWFLT